MFFDNLKDKILQSVQVEAEKLANKIALILERETAQVITDNNIIATGNLRKSIGSSVEKSIVGYLITAFTNAGYSLFVSDGTRPHFPPITAIRDWVKIKGLAYNIKSSKKKKSGAAFGNVKAIRSYKTMNDYNQINQIASAIAWSIYHKGTKGIKFFDLALKQAMPIIEKELEGTEFQIV